MKCHACGQDNADAALFCTACRRPLLAPSKPLTRLEPLAVSAASAALPPAPAPGDVGSRHRDTQSSTDFGPASRQSGYSPVLTNDEALEAMVGPSGAMYYLTRFDRLKRGEDGGWHWPALFVTWFWMLYRKMWTHAVLWVVAYIGVSIVVSAIAHVAPLLGGLLSLAWCAFWLIGPALFANRWYYNHCIAKIRDLRSRGGSKEQMVARMEAHGGTGNLVVVILAVVVIGFFGTGVLAAIALPAYSSYTVKAKVVDALAQGNEVADEIGRQYQSTGQLPADIDGIVAHTPHQSKYLAGVSMSIVGELELHVAPTPQIGGTIRLMPADEGGHHLRWSCSTDDLRKYAPKSCQ